MLLVEPFNYPEDQVGKEQPDQGIDEQGQLVSPPVPANLVALELQELSAVGNTVDLASGQIWNHSKDTTKGENTS